MGADILCSVVGPPRRRCSRQVSLRGPLPNPEAIREQIEELLVRG